MEIIKVIKKQVRKVIGNFLKEDIAEKKSLEEIAVRTLKMAILEQSSDSYLSRSKHEWTRYMVGTREVLLDLIEKGNSSTNK